MTVGGAPSGGTSPLASEMTAALWESSLLERLHHAVERCRGDSEEHVVGPRDAVLRRLDPQLAWQLDAGEVTRFSRCSESSSACSAVRV